MRRKIVVLILIIILSFSGCEADYHQLSYHYLNNNAAKAYYEKFSIPFEVYEKNLEPIALPNNISLQDLQTIIEGFLQKFFRYNYTFESDNVKETESLDNGIESNDEIESYYLRLRECVNETQADLNIDSLYISGQLNAFNDKDRNLVVRVDFAVNWRLSTDNSSSFQSKFPALHNGDNIYYISVYLIEQNYDYNIIAWIEVAELYGQTLLFSSKGIEEIDGVTEPDLSNLNPF